VRKLQAVFLLVGIGALTWLIWRLGPELLLEGIVDIGWGFILTCLAHANGLALDSLILRFFAGAPGRKVPYLHYLRASMSGHAINEATPFGKLGEITKYTILTERLAPARAAATLVAQNICSFVVNCGLIGLGAPIALFIFGVRGPMAVAFGVVGGVFLVAGIIGLVILHRGIGGWPFVLMRHAGLGRFRIPKDRVDRWRKGWRTVEETWQEASRDKAAMQTAWLCAITSRLSDVAETALILYFLGGEQILPAAVLSLGSSQAVSWTLFFVPMQVGTAEGSAYLVFSAAGLSPEIGVLVEIGRKLRRVVFISIGVALLGFDTFAQFRTRPSADTES
jgi:uncharacterized membrane protein YbhN (UPF0104 family)